MQQEYFIPGYPIALPLHVRTRPPTDYWGGHAVGLPAGKYTTKATRSAPIGTFDSTRWETFPQQFSDLCCPNTEGTYLGLEPTGTISGVG